MEARYCCWLGWITENKTASRQKKNKNSSDAIVIFLQYAFYAHIFFFQKEAVTFLLNANLDLIKIANNPEIFQKIKKVNMID